MPESARLYDLLTRQWAWCDDHEKTEDIRDQEARMIETIRRYERAVEQEREDADSVRRKDRRGTQ